MMPKRLVFFFIILLASGIYWLVSANKEYPMPTESYYVNDYADVLMYATRSTITREGERLFETTEDEFEGGAQIVFATFEVENLSEIANYDKTDIYRQWGIGKDDMGALVLMFFMDEGEDSLSLVETQVEVGYRMEPYLTPTKLVQILDDSISNDDYNWLLDMAVANLLYRLLEVAYVDIYQYESFSYDMDAYYDYLINGTIDVYYDTEPMSLFSYFFSNYALLADQLFFFIPALAFISVGGYGIFRAGGGSSGGMGIFRRRR
jgi:uncharacterized membrane protein YgcG